MYQVVLKGYIETENPEKVVEDIRKIVSDNNSDIVGDFNIYQLAPYVDFQKDVSNKTD